jgi:dihydroorotase
VSSGRHGSDLLIRNARAFAGASAGSEISVLVRDGKIERIAQEIEAESVSGDIPRIDAGGRTVISGLVDVHVHFRDPGLAHKEGWERGSAGALHGGVTSVVEVQNNPPLSVSLEALNERIEHVRARSRVDFGCLANLLPHSLDELASMAPYTPAFKLFLGCSTGMGGLEDRPTLRKLFAKAAEAGRMVVAHCEDEALLRAGKNAHPEATALEHHLVRSAEAEVRSIEQSIELCEETGAALHVFHISTAEGVERVRRARRLGLSVSSSTAPHYLLLSCEDAGRLGNLMKVNPSIKTPRDAEGVLAGLADGTVEAIGTDHAPHPLEEKTRDYKHAPSGMPSVDLLWPLTFELVRRGLLDPDTALASVTSRAAESLGLVGKGRLQAGFDGDLVLFDPKKTRRVVGADLPSRSRWSAYEGMELSGFPELVVRRGEVVFRDGVTTCAAGGIPLTLMAEHPGRSKDLLENPGRPGGSGGVSAG